MKEADAIDLSLLDPERDPQHWSMLMSATRLRVAGVVRSRSGELDPLVVVSDWAPPILAAAGILLLLGGAMVLRQPESPAMSQARRLAYLTESSMLRGQAPTGAELMAAIQLGQAR